MYLTLVAISCNCFCKAPLKGFYLYHNREFLTFSFSHKESLNEIGIWPEFIRDTFQTRQNTVSSHEEEFYARKFFYSIKQKVLMS